MQDEYQEMVKWKKAYKEWEKKMLADPNRILVKCNACGAISSRSRENIDETDCPICDEEGTLLPYKTEMRNT